VEALKARQSDLDDPASTMTPLKDKDLGLTIPPSLLQRADQVIE
jgi:hypothetical protein